MNQDTKTLLFIICFFIVVFVLIVYFKPDGEENTVPGSVATTETIPTTDSPASTSNTFPSDTGDTTEPEIPENYSYTGNTKTTSSAETTISKEEPSPFTENELATEDFSTTQPSGTETADAETETTAPETETAISDEDMDFPTKKEEPSTFSFEKEDPEKEARTPPEVKNYPALNKQVYYTVEKGDSLYKISRKMYGNGKYYARIEKANLDINPDDIEPGVKIIVPALGKKKQITPDTTLATETKTHLTPETTTAPSGPDTYTIKKGDNLESIARAIYGDPNLWGAIKKANPGINPKRLKIGQKITIPETPRAPEEAETTPATTSSEGTYTIQPGDTLGKIAKKLYGKESLWLKIQKANPELDPRRLTVGRKIKLPQTKTQED